MGWRWLALSLALLVGASSSAWAQGQAMYQWAIDVPRPDGKTCRAHVWIPPSAERIRGILIGGESSIAGDPAIRKACEDEGLAIIRAGIDGIFNYKKGPGPEIFLKTLDMVAETTGYSEIARARSFRSVTRPPATMPPPPGPGNGRAASACSCSRAASCRPPTIRRPTSPAYRSWP